MSDQVLTSTNNKIMKIKLEIIKKNCPTIFFCFAVALFCLLLCSKNSPLFPFNDWVDANAFFTVGKSMMNGIVPYRDLFEQKGPLLYLIYGIGYLLSNTSFIGVFILETISFTVFLYYCYKIIILFLKEKYILVILPVLANRITTSVYFVHGGSAEEFSLPLIAVSFYHIVRYFRNQEAISFRAIFINGILAGSIAMIKFSLLGFWLAWMMCLFISLILKKEISKSLQTCLMFLFAMCCAFLPWLIYFTINYAIKDFISAYVLVNTTAYVKDTSLIESLKNVIDLFWSNLILHNYVFLFIVVGIWYFVFSKKIFKQILPKITIILLMVFFVGGIYIGGNNWPYYFLPLTFFCLLGWISFFLIIQPIVLKSNRILFYIIVSLSFLYSGYKCFNNNNYYFINYKKNDLVQFKFAKIINEVDNATLLNYGFLDGGFYTAADIFPNIRYFERQNINYSRFPENMDGQNDAIKNKKVMFVVIRSNPNDDKSYSKSHVNIENVTKNYRLVSKEAQMFEGINFTYYLYKLKDL